MESLKISQPGAPATNGFKPSPTRSASEVSSSLLADWQQHAQQEDEVDLMDLLLIVKRRAWAIAGVIAAVMFLTVVATLQANKIYGGSFRVLVESVYADNDLSELTSILAEQQLSQSGLDYDTQIQVLRSPELLDPVTEELQQKYPELTYLTLLENLRISRVDETKILQISYTHPDPVQIQVVLDLLSESYLEYSLAERQTNLRQGINFVDSQLPDLQTQVNALQSQLENFRREHDFITPETQSTLVTSRRGELYTRRSELERQFSEAQQVFNTLQEESGALAALEDALVYQQLLSELRVVETEMAKELTRFEPSSLAITVLEEQRENMLPLLQQEAQRVVGTQQASAANTIQVLSIQRELLAKDEQQIAQLNGKLPSLIRQYTDLQRELEVAVETLSRFRLTGETLKIDAAQTEIPWQLIEVPTLPEDPISPNVLRNLLLGFVASILLGLGAALMLEKLDNVYHSIDELKAGTKLPLLGTLPKNARLQDSQTTNEGILSMLVGNVSKLRSGKNSLSGYYGYSGESSFLESLRVLHTNIKMLSSDSPIRSILISSAQPAEGKSTISSSLAQVATAMGQRVMIVDVDLRKPQVHNRLDLPNNLGLSNYISDSVPLKSVLLEVGSNGQLFAMTAGKIPPDPTKLLSSQRMQQLMMTFENSFDLVIYDAPPIAGLADVSLLGQHTDGLILVSRMGETNRTVLTQVIETLKLARITVLGMVANGVRSAGSDGYRYYAYGYGETELEAPLAAIVGNQSNVNHHSKRDELF